MTSTASELAGTPARQADPAVELGAVINDLMFRSRMSHTAMGRAIGVSQSTMSKKLRGLVGITTGELFAIAAALDVNPSHLVDLVERACRDSNPKPSDP